MESSTLILIGIGFLALMLLATIFVLISYSGLFDTVEVGAGKPLVSSLKVVYKYGEGPTKGMGTFFTEVTSIAPKLKCFGVYYDDPMEEHPAQEHQWAVGCVLAEGNNAPDSDLLLKFREEGYKTFEFPEVSHVVHTQFPCRTQLSILLGIFKVYPTLAEYVKRQKLCAHPWLEIYDGEMIYYMGPLAKQSEFYVPETNPDCQEQQVAAEMKQAWHSVKEQCFPLSKGKTSEKLKAKGKSDKRKNEGEHGKGQQEEFRGDAAGSSEVTIELKRKDQQVTNSEGQAEIQGKPEMVVKEPEETASGEHLQNVAANVVREETDAEAGQSPGLQSESKSSTPAGRVNTVTDIQGRRASSSVSHGRACSAGRIKNQTVKLHPAIGQRSASESIDLKKKRIQDSGITSTTVDAALLLDSDTLTDPETSITSARSWSRVSGDSSFQSEYSYPESPYSCDSYISDSSYVSESSFLSESPYTSEGTVSFTGGVSLLDLSSDSDGEDEKVVGMKSTVSAQGF